MTTTTTTTTKGSIIVPDEQLGGLPSSKSDELLCYVHRNYSCIDEFAAKYQLSRVNDLQNLITWAASSSKKLYDQKRVDELSKKITDLEKSVKAARVAFDKQTKANMEGDKADAKALDVAQQRVDLYRNRLTDTTDLSADLKLNHDTLLKMVEVAQEEFVLVDEMSDKRKAERQLLLQKLIEDDEKDLATGDTLKFQSKKEVADIAIALWRCALQENILSKTDHVGRARLFYTWVACSVQYNEKIFLQKNQDSTRSIDILAWGYGVCANYSLLFTDMFNAVTLKYATEIGVDTNFLAKGVSGFAKKSRRSQPVRESRQAGVVQDNTSGQLDNGHQWVAFPYKDANGDKKMKLIDILWGQGTAATSGGDKVSGLHNTTWFTNDNLAFQTQHIPDPRILDGEDMQGYYVEKKDRIPYDDLWKQDLPYVFPPARVIHLDIASLLPKKCILDSLTAQPFSFALDCAHEERRLRRAVYLRIIPSKNKELMFPFTEGANNVWTAQLPAGVDKVVPKDGSRIAQIIVPYLARESAALSKTPNAVPPTQIIEEVDVTRLDLQTPITTEQVKSSDYSAFTWVEVAQWDIGTKPKGVLAYITAWLEALKK